MYVTVTAGASFIVLSIISVVVHVLLAIYSSNNLLPMNIIERLCTAATCLIQPGKSGPVGDRIRQVPLCSSRQKRAGNYG